MRPGVIRGLVLAAALLAFAQPAGAAQPNIVLIVTDDQRWDTLQYMPTVQSELVGRGVTFTNAFVTNPLCCPSRASILTGAYSHTNGVYRNGFPMGGFRSFDDTATVATWLQDAGYTTAFIGKYINQYPGSYVPPGWDRWVAFWSDGYNSYGLDIDGIDFPVAEQTYSTDFFAQEAVSFINAAQRPFFLYIAPYAPHKDAIPAARHEGAFPDLAPWRPPNYDERDVSDKPRWLSQKSRLDQGDIQYVDRFRRKQLQSLLAVDDAVASVLQALGDTDALENTLILYTSDNGFLWGEHRLRGKKVPYEESIRVPFVVRYDALAGTPRTETRSVTGIDIAPTFAALAGTSTTGADGESIVPLLTNGDTAWRKEILVEWLGGPPPTYCAIRAQRYAFVTYKTGDRELYDLLEDRYQLRNLAGEPGWSSTTNNLRKRLARLCNPPPPGLSRKLLCTHMGTHRADVIVGSARYDIVCAQDGRDQIDPGEGKDYVFAGAGNDAVFARDGASDTLSCGGGADLAFVDADDRVRRDCEGVRVR